MSLNIYLLGVPHLKINNQIVEIDTRKAVAILAYMALAEERPSRDFLAAFLWPDFDQSRARAALRRTLSAMRRDVGKAYFDISRDSVAFAAKARIWVDVAEFQRQAQTGSTTGLESAISLYRDDFMAGFTLRDSPTFDEWQFFQGEQLRRTFSGVLEKLIEAFRDQSDWSEAIQLARRWLALDPLHEEAHRTLMALLAWAGERNQALLQYRNCVRVLDEELGVAPLPETTDLYHHIQRNQFEPLTPKPEPDLPATAINMAVDSPQPTFPTQIPLVGREEVMDSLAALYEEIELAGTVAGGRFAIIGGEAGIGKTRLAEEFLVAQRAQGARVIMTRCYEGEQDLAYGPVVGGLRQALAFGTDGPKPSYWQKEIGRLLPEEFPLDQRQLPPLDGPGAQARFFLAISQAFTALLNVGQAGILCVDDLQWADQATLDLLIFLVRRLPELKLFFLGTWRTPDAFQESIFRQFLSTGKRTGNGRYLELTRLSQSDIHNLLQQLEKPVNITPELFNRSEGLPFFLNAYLTHPDPDDDWPDSFRDLLHSRLSRIGQTGHQLLQSAAVIGRSFDYNTLRNASGRSEDETVQAIETLMAHGLVIESAATMAVTTTEQEYYFSHQALRDLVYEETSFARRRLLHRRVAESLSKQRSRPIGATSAQIAHHFLAAGQETEAAEYFYQAGNYAKDLYANNEALSHFQSALALEHEAVSDLHEAIGDLQKLAGAYGAALAAYEKAAALAVPADLYRLEQKLGSVYHRQGDWPQAVHHFSAALAAITSDKEADRARILADWSRTAYRSGDLQEAEVLAKESLALAERTADLPALAQTHNILGMLARSQGDFTRAGQHLLHSLEIAPQLGNPSAQIAALNNLALLARDQADFSQAEQHLKNALDLCRTLGDRHREAALLNNLADLYHLAGDELAARSFVRQSVAIMTEIGSNAGEWQPEIWKLTTW